jgi:hypothetical protein
VPFRTIVMLIALTCHAVLSSVTDFLFRSKKLDLKFDFFHVFEQR